MTKSELKTRGINVIDLGASKQGPTRVLGDLQIGFNYTRGVKMKIRRMMVQSN